MQENEKMWQELETTYSLSIVTQTENELQNKKEELMQMYRETQAVQRVKSAKEQLYNQKEAQRGKHNQRENELSRDLRTKKSY